MNSIWLEGVNIPQEKELNENKKAEVCIIGGGIFGLATAYLLTKQGLSVILLERDKIGAKVSAHTTAKITSQHGLIYHYLEKQYGLNYAKKYFEANERAIQDIQQIIEDNSIECDFERKNSYVYTTFLDEKEKIQEEIQALQRINPEAKEVEKLDLPFEIIRAIEFPNQAQMHPVKYMKALKEKIIEQKGEIFCHTTCLKIEKQDKEYICHTEKAKVTAQYVVIATHYPFINFPGIYFSKIYQSSSYVIGAEINQKLPKGMYINVCSPIYSIRTANIEGKPFLLLGGGDHKTGEEVSYKSSYGKLEEKIKDWYPGAKVKYRYSTRDCITLDKIPYIGEFSHLLPNVFVGTGFNKWGMTSSHVAARLISDKIRKQKNEYEEIFTATRVNPIVNIDEVKNMVSQTAKSLVVDKIKQETKSLEDIKNDEGGIVEIQGSKVGIYKDKTGKIYAIDPICTHLGCLLSWNDADKTWDCPCHGSRFDYTGKNLYNPALKDLKIKEITGKEK